MCAKDATNNQDVSNSAEPAPNTETSKTSKPKYRLLCNPRNLLKPPYSQPKIPEMTREQARKVKDYFNQRYVRLEGVARDKGWIR